MEKRWLKEALFAGHTANSFKFGTVLTLGWFWVRVHGCTVLYRGVSMDEINFSNVLTVTEIASDQIQPPSYISHSNNTSYFYVVQRISRCGNEERTLSASVIVRLDSEGDLTEPPPNSVCILRNLQRADNKIEFIWFYSPIDQKSEPVCFNVYYDNGTGEIDYENPVTTIPYAGRIFYSHQSEHLEAGRHLFAIRVEDAAGREDISSSLTKFQIDTASPEAINILNAEAI
jgi:hypothetical protein